MYKMIVFDIDGTLIPFGQNELSPEIKTLFKRIKEKGFTLCLATGRDFVSIGDIHENESIDYFIGANGSFIYDLKNTRYIFNSSIKYEDYENYHKDILLTHQNNVYNVILSDNEYVYVWDHKKMDGHWFWEPFKDRFRKIEFAKDQINPNQFHLITINCTDNATLIKESRNYFSQNNSSLNIQAYWKNGFFVANHNVSKATSIKILCEKLNINIQSVIAFGDGENDLQMLKTVGLGVAMDNASELVKSVAKDVTTSVEEFGAITYLEKIGII